MNADGSGQAQVTSNQVFDLHPSWSHGWGHAINDRDVVAGQTFLQWEAAAMWVPVRGAANSVAARLP
ncbi:MAG: hypothetical protein ACRDJ9_32715 [Dehalococcoidia bacterium]